MQTVSTTLYRKIAGGEIVTQNDFFNNVKSSFQKEWYAINSNPHYPTHTFKDGELVRIPR